MDTFITFLSGAGLVGVIWSIAQFGLGGRRENRQWLREKKFSVYIELVDLIGKWEDAVIAEAQGTRSAWPESFSSVYQKVVLLLGKKKRSPPELAHKIFSMNLIADNLVRRYSTLDDEQQTKMRLSALDALTELQDEATADLRRT